MDKYNLTPSANDSNYTHNNGFEALPSFDTLKEMAEQSPEELEALRLKMVSDLIENAPASYQARLKGIQFQIDARRQVSDNSLSACMTISQMMHDSFNELRYALNELSGQDTPMAPIKPGKDATTATILPFKK